MKKVKISIVTIRTEQEPGTVGGLWHIEVKDVKGGSYEGRQPEYTLPLEVGVYEVTAWRTNLENEVIGDIISDGFEVTEISNVFIQTASGMVFEQYD